MHLVVHLDSLFITKEPSRLILSSQITTFPRVPFKSNCAFGIASKAKIEHFAENNQS